MIILDGNDITITPLIAIKLFQPKGTVINTNRISKENPYGYNTLAYVIEGKCEYRYSHKTLYASKGDIVYLDAHHIIDQHVIEDYYTYCFNFVAKSGFSSEPVIFKPRDEERYLVRFKEGAYIYNRENPGWKNALRATTLRILSNIEFDTSYSSFSDAKIKKFSSAKNYIFTNLSDYHLCVESVAEHCGITTSYLRKLFKEFTNTTPVDYIKNARINYAADLLKNSEFSVNEAATQAGFNNTSYFCKEFRNSMGCSPLEFKKNGSKK